VRRRPALALVTIAIVLAGWLRARSGDPVESSGVDPTGSLSRRPTSLDARGLAAPGRLRAGDGHSESAPATDGPVRSPAPDIDDFPRIDTATLEIRLEWPADDVGPRAYTPSADLLVSLRSPGGGYATDVNRVGAVQDPDGVSVTMNEVPSGDRIVMARDGDRFWTPEVVPVVAPRTTCRMKFHRGDLTRFTLAAQGRDGPVGATIDVYDGTSHVDRVEVNAHGRDSPGGFAYLADRPLTFVCSGYPGWRCAGAPEPITVAGRDGKTTDVTFEIPTATKVRLFAADAAGAGLMWASVCVWNRGRTGDWIPSGEPQSGLSDETGEATMDLLPGRYVARVFDVIESPGFGPRTIPFDVPPGTAPRVEVVLDARAPATIRLLRRRGAPVSNEEVRAVLIDGAAPADTIWGGSTTDSAGLARLPIARPGRYRFAVNFFLSDPIALSATSEVDDLDFPERRVGNASLRLAVYGPSGRPMDQAVVRVVREGDRWGPFMIVQKDSAWFDGLESGPWRVEVLSSWILAEQFRPFEGRVVLKSGETRSIEIRLKAR